MGSAIPEFVVVKVSTRRFIVARLVTERLPDNGERPVPRYYAVTCPLPYKDAAATLLVAMEHGEGAVPRASRPLRKTQWKGAEYKITASPPNAEPTPTGKSVLVNCRWSSAKWW